MAVIEYTIPGPPVGKERARRDPSTGRWFTPRKTRDYQRHAKSCATVARMALGVRWPRNARYRVEIVAYAADARRRDADNIAKAVLDAANLTLWHDDSQVTELSVRLEIDRANPRVEVRVEVVA